MMEYVFEDLLNFVLFIDVVEVFGGVEKLYRKLLLCVLAKNLRKWFYIEHPFLRG